jgi:hypothetical protein
MLVQGWDWFDYGAQQNRDLTSHRSYEDGSRANLRKTMVWNKNSSTIYKVQHNSRTLDGYLIKPSQGLFIYTGHHKTTKGSTCLPVYPCTDRDSNPRYQSSSSPRPCSQVGHSVTVIMWSIKALKVGPTWNVNEQKIHTLIDLISFKNVCWQDGAAYSTCAITKSVAAFPSPSGTAAKYFHCI